jgi:hypothetical protein
MSLEIFHQHTKPTASELGVICERCDRRTCMFHSFTNKHCTDRETYAAPFDAPAGRSDFQARPLFVNASNHRACLNKEAEEMCLESALFPMARLTSPRPLLDGFDGNRAKNQLI